MIYTSNSLNLLRSSVWCMIMTKIRDIVLIDRRQDSPRIADLIWAFAFGEIGMIKRLRPMPDGSVKISMQDYVDGVVPAKVPKEWAAAGRGGQKYP